MPSPRAITVPPSATSTVTAKLPSCSRMILEMSSALMLMVRFALRSSLLDECLTNLAQLRAHTAVVHRAADSSDQAADQLAIDRRGKLDLLSSCAAKAGFERLRVLRRQRPRAGDLGSDDVLVRKQALAVGLRDQRDEIEPAALDQHANELSH